MIYCVKNGSSVPVTESQAYDLTAANLERLYSGQLVDANWATEPGEDPGYYVYEE